MKPGVRVRVRGDEVLLTFTDDDKAEVEVLLTIREARYMRRQLNEAIHFLERIKRLQRRIDL